MKKANFKRVNSKSVIAKVAVPVGCAIAGSIAGAAAGKTLNLGVALALGVAGIAFDEPGFTYAAAGAAVVTPSKSTTAAAGIDGLDGIADQLSAAKNRAFGQTASILRNFKLDAVADKLPVSGLAGLGDIDDAYQAGYIEGVSDAVDEQIESSGMESLEGIYNPGAVLASGQPERRSVEAMLLSSRIKA